MNHCDKIRYEIYLAAKAPFRLMVKTLIGQLPEDGVVFRLVFFGNPADNGEYVVQRDELRIAVLSFFGSNCPAFSYVAQPPLNGGLVMEVLCYMPDENDRISFKKYNDSSYVLLENADGRFLYSGGWQGDLSADIGVQSREVFQRIGGLLAAEEFAVDSIVRQWNYIERITVHEAGRQHYQMFNNARGEFYASGQWVNGYPAATGIGSRCGGVLVDFDAVKFKNTICFCTSIDNKLQVAAHAYSDNVLKEGGSEKASPKFERAKSLNFDQQRIVYVSGTASIRGEESLGVGSIERQTKITLENISLLTDNMPMSSARVYLKHREDYEVVKHCFALREKNVAVLFVEADVCRDELLIEIEGIVVES